MDDFWCNWCFLEYFLGRVCQVPVTPLVFDARCSGFFAFRHLGGLQHVASTSKVDKDFPKRRSCAFHVENSRSPKDGLRNPAGGGGEWSLYSRRNQGAEGAQRRWKFLCFDDERAVSWKPRDLWISWTSGCRILSLQLLEVIIRQKISP